MFISIVIAVYNEERNVEQLTRRIYTTLRSLPVEFEVIYVVDGTDDTYTILKGLQPTHPHLVLSHSATPRGFGPAFTEGFSRVSPEATHILTMDGDLNHQPEEIPLLIDALKAKNADIIIGSRYITAAAHNSPLWKKTISFIANKTMQYRFGLHIKDKTSGYRLYTAKALQTIIPSLRCRNFEFLMEALILAAKRGYSVTEVPITFTRRIHGESKLPLLKTARGYCRLLFRSF